MNTFHLNERGVHFVADKQLSAFASEAREKGRVISDVMTKGSVSIAERDAVHC